MQQVVIDTATSIVKRHGFTDFSSDGSFNGVTETLLVEGVDYTEPQTFDLSTLYQWSSGSQVFIPVGPTPGFPPFVISPNGTAWRIVVDNSGTLSTQENS